MEDESNTSPVPQSVIEENPNKNATVYSFADAMKKVIEGRKVTRLDWNTNEAYGFLDDGYLKIFRDNAAYVWHVVDTDMFANDWVVLPEPNE